MSRENNLQTIFHLAERELRRIEGVFLNLEKAYLDTESLYKELDTRLSALDTKLNRKNTGRLRTRLQNIRLMLHDLRNKRGHNGALFQNIYLQIMNAKEKMGNEILSPKLYRILEEKILSSHNIKAPHIKRKKVSYPFLLAKNGSMNFLIPCEKKIWSGKVPARSSYSFSFKMNNKKTTIPFENLPGHEITSTLKVAALCGYDNGKLYGFLCDTIEGKTVLSAETLRKNTEYLPLSDGKYEPYFYLRGNRYFFRKMKIRTSMHPGKFNRNNLT